MKVARLALLFFFLSSTATLHAQRPDGFGVNDKTRPPREFGKNGDTIVHITSADRDSARQIIRKYDRNGNNLIERQEVRHWKTEDFERWDLDSDGHLDIYEKALEGINWGKIKARRRKEAESNIWIEGYEVTPRDRSNALSVIKKYDKNENGQLEPFEVPTSWKVADAYRRSDWNGDGNVTLREMQRRQAEFRMETTAKNIPLDASPLLLKQRNECSYLAYEMIRRNDRNKNKALEPAEWQRIPGRVAEADVDGNGFVAQNELTDWLAAKVARQASSNRYPAAVPDWFIEKDRNFDGQVLLSEYASRVSPKVQREFARFDRNGDGIITTAESLSAGSSTETFNSFRNIVIEPGIGIVSEISIGRRISIADIDVQFSISHYGPEDLDAFLTSPSGDRIELFSGKSKKWSGSDFHDTILDDEASSSIASHVPPFSGAYQPEGVPIKGRSSLSKFYGKPAYGTWQLLIRSTRSDRPGLLHGWALIVKPDLKVKDEGTNESVDRGESD